MLDSYDIFAKILPKKAVTGYRSVKIVWHIDHVCLIHPSGSGSISRLAQKKCKAACGCCYGLSQIQSL